MKIDTSKIDGFDGMSAEDKVNALLDLEVPEDLTEEVKKLKGYVDKYTKELADNKREKREWESEKNKSTSEAEQRIKELEEKYSALEKKSKTDALTAQYKAMGYDNELALETATAQLEGDYAKVLANQEKFNTSFEKKLKAEALKGTPHPDDKGEGNKPKTKEDLAKMTPQERYKFSKEHSEEYKKIYGGN